MVIVNHRQARHGDARAEPDSSHPSSAGTRGYLASMRTNVSARGLPISAVRLCLRAVPFPSVMLSPYSSTLTVGITRIVWMLCKKRRQRDEERRAMVCGGVCAGFNFLCGGGRSFPVLAGVRPARFASVG
jgi:hypothetical protein